jgi:PAS domain S-box-containing protein
VVCARIKMEQIELIKLDAENLFSMQSLTALFKFATEGIIISDKNGTIVRANPASERIFGYDAGELTGRVIEDLVPRRY